MLTQNTLETLRHLKLHGMAQALEEQRDTPNMHALGFEERLALLVDRECVFRLMPATDSAASRPPIPRHAGRVFRGMPATP